MIRASCFLSDRFNSTRLTSEDFYYYSLNISTRVLLKKNLSVSQGKLKTKSVIFT